MTSYQNGAQYLSVDGVLYTASSPVAEDLVGDAYLSVGTLNGVIEGVDAWIEEAFYFANAMNAVDVQQLTAASEGSDETTAFVPSLQRVEVASDPSRDMTLVWHGESAAPAAVEYRVTGSTAWMSAGAVKRDFPEETDKIFVATVANLSPDTIYDWRPAGSGSIGIRKFRTAPDHRKRDLRVAVASDWQRSEANATDPFSDFNTLNDLIALKAPDVVILNGDFVSDNGAQSDTLTDKWQIFIEAWSTRFVDTDGCMIPVCAVAGNHEAGDGIASGGSLTGDQPYGYMDKVFSTFYRPNSPNSGGAGYGYFTIGAELLCVGLETNHGTPLSEQVTWLETLLAERSSDYRHVFVFGHLGPVALENSQWDLAAHTIIREQIAPIIQQYPNCCFAMQGHCHNLMATRRVLFVGNPAGGVNAWSEDPTGIRWLGAGGWGAPDWLAFDAQDQASDGTLGDGSVLIEYLLASNQAPRNVTPDSDPANSSTDPATKHFWTIDFREADQVAKAISLENSELISLTEAI